MSVSMMALSLIEKFSLTIGRFSVPLFDLISNLVFSFQTVSHSKEVTDMNSDSATYRTCRSDYNSIWWSAVYIYKTFILLYSAYLSWAIRAVTIPSMNDSVAIILSCLVTTFTGSATAAICVAFSDRPNVTSTVTMVSIWLCTTFTLCVVYVPKVNKMLFIFQNLK